MVPTGMTSRVHAFDAREGRSFRISLTYDSPAAAGKTTAHTVKLVTNEQVVEVVEFETTDPALRGEIRRYIPPGRGRTQTHAVSEGGNGKIVTWRR